jgi:tol-pal system protein YbgF
LAEAKPYVRDRALQFDTGPRGTWGLAILRLVISSYRVGVAFAAIFLCIAAPLAFAQSPYPPGSVPGADDGGDPAALVLRVQRLEDELRHANGAIEELQNQQQRLQEQLKRFQEDVEFRFSGGAGQRPIAPAPAPGPGAPAAPNAPLEPSPMKPSKHGDAYDPSVDPNAVGAPKPLGTTSPSAPLDQPGPVAGAPLDLSHPGPVGPLSDNESPTVITGPGAPPPDGPREQLNAAIETFRAGQYEQAETQLRAFLAHNAGSRLVPDATFFLGESYFLRSRPREAAEQYLKLSTDYAKSSRAPEGMLRLGESLAMLGNNEQACATFGEVGKRYPTAAAGVKKGVEREMQKDHC